MTISGNEVKKRNATNILLVWDRMGDYHRARATYLNEHTGYTVFTADYGAADKLYNWQSKQAGSHFLLSEKSVHTSDSIQRIINFISIIRTKKVDAVFLPGWSRPTYIWFALIARLLGMRTYSFVESWYGHNKLVNQCKSILVKVCFNGFFASGSKAFAHLTHYLKVAPEKIAFKYSVVNNAHFYTTPKAINPQEPLNILCIARYSHEKNLLFLLHCFRKSSLHSCSRLRLAGGGQQKELLIQMAADNVEVGDWIDYDNLPQAYATADVLVLPSNFEPWGLVVNEAMAAGLPVVVSDACGCAADLVEQGINGYIFTCSDEQSFISSLNKIFEQRHRLAVMGQASKKIIDDQFSLHHWSAGVEYLVTYA